MLNPDDTIVALATPPGRGGIGIVRVSGSRALEISRRIFCPREKGMWPARPRCLTLGYVHNRREEALDQVLAVFFPAPHSYTTQDVVEIQAHGSPALLRRIELLYVSEGARPAGPGEFTLRAFLGGRLSLSQAEAVAQLIQSRSRQESRLALASLKGGLNRRLHPLRESLLALSARIEAWLDYPEEMAEPETPVFRQDLRQNLLAPVETLLHERQRGRVFQEGALLLLCGRPNVGKSSLFNALLGRERALVSDLPGTTRDGLEEEIFIKGLTCRLRDSAGLGQETPLGGREKLACLGQTATREILPQADLLLLLLDGSVPLNGEDEAVLKESEAYKRLLVITKADLPPAWSARRSARFPEPLLEISVRQGDLLALEEAIYQILTEGQDEPLPNQVVVSARQMRVLQEMESALIQTGRLLEQDPPAWELLAWELQQALRLLGRLDGQGTPDEVLEEIFSAFCLGK
ncbi:MAG: tRNA uridine-5-carboxymethylaminomethyl(34) synthesis GTPase MnmE [Desulfarculales bacterium]|jgi:tRNA modification GTPase|nr:tRNA uridine-5-carboxymethylaminomethyl(34) synthesis GTPase MnmE [Desulfarculales bacterium]